MNSVISPSYYFIPIDYSSKSYLKIGTFIVGKGNIPEGDVYNKIIVF